MLQILDAIFRDPNDTTCVKMIYANQSKFAVAACACLLIVAGVIRDCCAMNDEHQLMTTPCTQLTLYSRR
jgi:hypothetical protein